MKMVATEGLVRTWKRGRRVADTAMTEEWSARALSEAEVDYLQGPSR